ncbi:MAG: ferredoxin [Crocinitomicaceae bacterium]|nr:ferredoxin [Crocinitomicaceae bacterium]
MIRIIHFREKCVGCNACVEAAPFRWRISRKDGKSILINSVEKKQVFSLLTGDDELSANILAANNCPVKVIKIEKFQP